MPRRSASCLTLLPDESAAALACKLACSAARSSCCSSIRVICHSPYMVPTLSARSTNTTIEMKRTTTPTVNFDTRPKRILGLEGRARPVRRSSLRDSTDGWSDPRRRLPGNPGAGTPTSRGRAGKPITTSEMHEAWQRWYAVSYTHLRAHETDSYLVCRLLLEK